MRRRSVRDSDLSTHFINTVDHLSLSEVCKDVFASTGAYAHPEPGVIHQLEDSLRNRRWRALRNKKARFPVAHDFNEAAATSRNYRYAVRPRFSGYEPEWLVETRRDDTNIDLRVNLVCSVDETAPLNLRSDAVALSSLLQLFDIG